jgi:hypothetical protein
VWELTIMHFNGAGKIWQSLEFAALEKIDYPEVKLSARRRQQQWGWLNERFFQVKYRKQRSRSSSAGPKWR